MVIGTRSQHTYRAIIHFLENQNFMLIMIKTTQIKDNLGGNIPQKNADYIIITFYFLFSLRS